MIPVLISDFNLNFVILLNRGYSERIDITRQYITSVFFKQY